MPSSPDLIPAEGICILARNVISYSPFFPWTSPRFVNKVIDCLTQSGFMHASQLYESPFTDFSPKGIDGVFAADQAAKLVTILDRVRETAAPQTGFM